MTLHAKIASPLSRKAVLVSVNISQWTARKIDKKVTDETNAKYHAAQDAGRYNKLLIAKEQLAELQSLVSKARTLHYSMTRPWADDGPRILANQLFAKFSDEFRVIKRDFNEAADKFEAEYPSFVEDAKKRLNGLFRDEDYPSAREIRSKFQLTLTVLPFPDAEDFRADLDADTIADLKRELIENTANVLDNAMKATVNDIIENVGHMATKLAEYRPSGGKGDKSEGVFRDSLVKNVRDLANVLPAFNLTDDPKLTAITNRIVKELCVEDAKTLRENADVREAVQKSADEIVSAMSDFFG